MPGKTIILQKSILGLLSGNRASHGDPDIGVGGLDVGRECLGVEAQRNQDQLDGILIRPP